VQLIAGWALATRPALPVATRRVTATLLPFQTHTAGLRILGRADHRLKHWAWINSFFSQMTICRISQEESPPARPWIAHVPVVP
jgi:hypothetical protein